MKPTPSASLGYLDSLRALGDGCIASVQDRVELLVIELQEEKCRLLQAYIWISAAVFMGAMACTFASLTLVYLYWDSARLAVLSGLTAFYILALVLIIINVRSILARQPKPLAATQAELAEDRQCFRS